ncbi:glycogen-binding domain-containing protein [Desulfospira joergensenii]|uniref:glycogen-binding domain-containing protein n=1 Tax=Desulfospira joergensenii TaxID=53329 RepID=UPI0003B56B67|nr:glycogen-binding domain-containing protein [Desulfospira joergensenii]
MSGEKIEQKKRKVEFFLNAPQASEVILLGDFNEWNGKKHSLKKGKLGTWEGILMLPPGTYEYKYLVDGHWWEKTSNHHNRINSFGTYNNLITVDE